MALSLARSCGSPACRPAASGSRKSCVRVCASVTVEKASLDISKMSPIHDRVLVRPIEEEKRTPGGILLPKGPPKANSDAHIGEVLAVGDEVDLPIKAGDMILFQKYAMAEVEVKEGQILFVAQKSIVAKLE